MRKISAHYIFPVGSAPLKNGIVVLDDSGLILDVIDTGGILREAENIEFYNGILVPGFVNAHCHLELSHLRGKFAEKTGLCGFIQQVKKLRESNPDEIITEAARADREMQDNGIVAVGDISNNALSFEVKQKSKILYHNFVEIFTSKSGDIPAIFNNGLLLYDQLRSMGLKASITPHAPYSVALGLYDLISKFATQNNSILSVHNQESEAENHLFLYRQGELADFFFKDLKVAPDFIATEGINSLHATLPHLPAANGLLLVHNTFTSEKDVDFAQNYSGNISWVLCPNSNLFIEDTLPDITMFRRKHLCLALGTDGYTSNHHLSILGEMKTISRYLPDIPFTELLKWATLNGALALGMDKITGTIEKGKDPGLNLIHPFDFENQKLLPESKVSVII